MVHSTNVEPSLLPGWDVTQDVPRDVSTKMLECVLVFLSFIALIITVPVSLFFIFRVVDQYEKAVIFRLGRLKKGGARGPGMFFILPCIDTLIKVDLRTVSFDVPSQEILTSDFCTVNVNAVVYYKILDPLKAVVSVYNYKSATLLVATACLRNILCKKRLTDLLSERNSIAEEIAESLETIIHIWGIKIESVLIKDVSLPGDMQRSMATEAEASREAKAKVVNANGEKEAAWTLKTAADVIGQNPAAIQLRYLQTLTSIAAHKNKTIAFPLSIAHINKLF